MPHACSQKTELSLLLYSCTDTSIARELTMEVLFQPKCANENAGLENGGRFIPVNKPLITSNTNIDFSVRKVSQDP